MDLMSYIEKGGMIGYILLFMLTVGLTTILWKYLQIAQSKKNRAEVLKQLIAGISGADDKALVLSYIRSSLDEYIGKLESGLGIVKTIASLSPLLGLLGTVIGILFAFETISTAGLADASRFAGGISLALVTTIMGLIIAIPHYVGYNYLVHMLESLEAIMIKEADSMLVENEK